MRQLRPGVFFSNWRLPERFLHYLGFTTWSPGVMEFGCEARVNKIHTTLFSAPQTQVYVCMRGQGIVFAFLPGVGTLSLPCLPSPEARPVCARQNPRWGSMESEGVLGRSVVTLLRVQVWLRGNLCTPQLLRDPECDLSQFSIWENA